MERGAFYSIFVAHLGKTTKIYGNWNRLPSLKQNGGLEDDCFLLGPGTKLAGAFAVSFRDCT